MFSDTHQVEIALPDYKGVRRMSGPTYLGWKVPVDGGLFNIYAIGWKGDEAPGALCIYFHPDDERFSYECVIIGDDEKFKNSEKTFRGRISHGRADKLRENLPELLDSGELTEDVKKALSIIK
jgi:hypothetical protein